MNPYVLLIFNVVILAALGATILYARKLSKQFRDLQADRKPFEKLIESLNNAASRADAATRALREAAQRDGDRLQKKTGDAQGLVQELELVIQAGDALARRLQTLAVRTSRTGRRDEEPPEQEQERDFEASSGTRGEEKTDKPVRTRAEKELLEALRAKQRSS